MRIAHPQDRIRYVYRRRFGEGADIIALVQALGGSGDFGYFYDGRFGASVGGGVVSQLTDFLGKAPALTASGTARPSYTAATGALTFDGVSNYMASAAAAQFDLSTAQSLVFVGSVPGNSNPRNISVSDASTPTRSLGIEAAASAAAYGGATPVTAVSGVAETTTVRLWVASIDGTNLNIDCPNVARVSTALAAQAAGSCVLTLGGQWAATNLANMTWLSQFRLNRVVTSSDLTAILAWAEKYRGAVHA